MSADDPAAKTWAGDSWKHGGSPIWNGGSYDPETNLTYWGTGNPNPGWNGDRTRARRQLYSDRVVALDADTGKLKWYYQFTPGDEYDWDSTQVPVLADIEWKGKPRKVMLWANRNGFFYVLDRTTGEFLLGKPFIKQTWAVGIDENGRPIKAPKFWPKPMGGIVVDAGFAGRHKLVSAVLQPANRPLLYVRLGQLPGPFGQGRSGPVGRRAAYTREAVGGAGCGETGPPADWPRAAGRRSRQRAGVWLRITRRRPKDTARSARIDPKTGEKKWDFKMVDNTECGVLSTAGDLVFGGGMDGDFVALDAKTGEPLWHVVSGRRQCQRADQLRGQWESNTSWVRATERCTSSLCRISRPTVKRDTPFATLT